MENFCVECGTRLSPGWSMCPECGRPTGRRPTEAPQTLFEMPPPGGYTRYEDVPFFRKQWFFWITFFFFAPVALGVLVTGEVYYVKKGKVKRFGMLNRLVAAVLLAFFAAVVFKGFLLASGA